MVCVTDDERRAAASLLRSFADGGMWGEFIDYCSSAGPSRLADLIEPSCDASATRDMSQTRRSDVDHEALLAIADEMDIYTRCPDDDRCGKQMPPLVIHYFAHRIREACGETQDD